MNKLKCATCENELVSKRSDAKYCSKKCRLRQETINRTEKKRRERKPVLKHCKACNNEFTASVRNPHQIYCSKPCISKAANKRRAESGRKKEYDRKYAEKKRLECKPVLKHCKVCSNEFTASLRHSHQIYCSKICREQAWYKRYVESGSKKECDRRHAALKKKTDRAYHDKIYFSGNKKHVLDRDNHTCVNCGKTKGLVVHHKDHSGQTEKPNNDMANLVTLCRSCHMKEHSGENNKLFIAISKEQILRARSESSSWTEVASKLGVDRALVYKRRKQYGIY